jgi:biotin carboxylase
LPKKKILILNGSHSEIPLIKAARELGLYVYTTGNNPNSIGHRYANQYIKMDFSDQIAILGLSRKLKIDAICSSANDFGAITASYVAEKLSLPGHDNYKTALIIHQKDKFKCLAEELDISTPKAIPYDSVNFALKDKESFIYPLLVKPVDLTGGKGITKVIKPLQLKPALEKAYLSSRAKRIIIEPFINGTLHSLSTFLVNKKVVLYFSDNEYSTLDPFHVTASFSPAVGIINLKESLIFQIEKIAESLSLVDGIFHSQYIKRNNKAYIIDVARRCSGDYYPIPVKHSLGIDWAKWIVKAEMGLDCKKIPKNIPSGFYGRYCIMSPSNGIFKKVKIHETLKNKIINSFKLVKEGHAVAIQQKIMIIIMKFKSPKEVIILKKLEKLIKLDIE